MKILIAQVDVGAVGGGDGESWADSVALEIDEVAEAVGAFVHTIEAEGELAAKRLVEIGRETTIVEGAALNAELVQGGETCFLGDTIDDAACAAAPEDE